MLVRHGETTANIQQVWHGHTDTELTDIGRQQARSLADYFHNYLPKVDAIYASPLQRAHITAQQIANATSNTVITDKRLMEFGLGEWEDRGLEELQSELGFFEAMINDEHHRAPGAETRHEVTARVVAGVEDIRRKHAEENVVIVAHGLAISFAIAHWMEKDSTNWLNYRQDNTAVSEIDIERGELISLNCTDHLDNG